MASKIEQLLKKLCPDGVEYKPLGEVCSIEKGVQLNRQGLLEEGPYPVINGGVNPSGYWTEYNREPNRITISQGGASAGYVNWLESAFWAGAHCYVLESPIDGVDYRYLYHVVKWYEPELMSAQIGAGIPSVSNKTLASLLIPLPPIEIQREVVKVLDKFALLEAELEAELAKRKKQYEHYRRALLAGDAVVGADVLGGPSQRGAPGGRPLPSWPRVKLGEVCEIGTGSSNTDEQLEEGKYPFYVRSQEVRWKNEFEYDDTSVITSGDGVGVGKIFHYATGKYALHQRAYRIHPIDESLNAKYLYYYFKTEFLDYINKSAFQSSVTSIRKPMLLNFEIPLPPLAEQERIVAILDRFDALCNSLVEGLPAEIERRKKQYAYYRDNLLTFKKKGAA